jgi:predicted nucleic acid-binding protein
MSVNFLDSNIFIYLFDATAQDKQTTAQNIIFNALKDQSACISFQVIQETLNVLTRKLAIPVKLNDALAFLQQVLEPLCKITPSTALYVKALSLQNLHRFSFYDSVIVAAALQAGCTQLLTEDLQDGQFIEDLKIVNPFKIGLTQSASS